jgi:SOS response regulatory protein OraA/RecX
MDARDADVSDDADVVGSEAAGPDAVELALRALRHRDLSEHELDRKLAARGVGEVDRERVLETVRRTGLLDDCRFAQGRAAALAARGAGDAFVRDALRRAGVPADTVEDALGELEPEAERARLIVARRGSSPRTARYLSGKGFSRETVAAVVASETFDALG